MAGFTVDSKVTVASEIPGFSSFEEDSLDSELKELGLLPRGTYEVGVQGPEGYEYLGTFDRQDVLGSLRRHSPDSERVVVFNVAGGGE